MSTLHKDQAERERIVEKFADIVWRVALSRTGREEAAEEVFQDVFLRLCQKERSFENDEHIKAWLIRTTLICCRRYLSSYFKNNSLSLDEISEVVGEVPSDDTRTLYNALLRLPAKYRIPIVLYYIEEVPTDACLSILKLKANTFYSRLSRGKQLLKKELKGEDYFV